MLLHFTRSIPRPSAAIMAMAVLAACGPVSEDANTEVVREPLQLGPVDGHDLPGAAPDRIAIGDVAPDFNLVSYRDDTLSLTDYRGEHEIILVFYRGSW